MTDNGPNRLRAPDPTLDAAPPVLVGVEWGDNGPLQAHRLRPCVDDDTVVLHLCSGDEAYDVQRAAEARWFAVPCRECFPDAPPPGWSEAGYEMVEDPHLSWQLEDAR